MKTKNISSRFIWNEGDIEILTESGIRKKINPKQSIDYTVELCEFISQKYPLVFLRKSSLPKPYCGNSRITKAIILGADPSNSLKNHCLQYAFGLENENSPYFQIIKENLLEIGLTLKDIYVQNIIQNYMKEETEKNKYWNEIGLLWLGEIKRELDSNFDRSIPIIITAYKVLKLIHNKSSVLPAKEIYQILKTFDPSTNYFNREVICLFRHPNYHIARWKQYRDFLINYFNA